MAERPKRKWSPDSLEAIAVLVVIAFVVGGGVVGWLLGRESAPEAASTAAVTPEPGHVGGANLPVAEFGDPVTGAMLWEEKRCADCHSIAGQGGSDAPPLDYMRGHVSAREIADMSGQIWNHVPAMVEHFGEEGIPFPTFESGEMADLVAFLHNPEAGAASTGGTGEDSHALGSTDVTP